MKNSIYLIGNAHIDPVWLWQWQDGFAEIKATFRAALDRIEEFPGFVFTSACAGYYDWVEENAPELFAELKQRVREGRFAVVGGFWVQPDCNIPSGESFCRHALYSQRYFKERFGVTATVGYNVDSFGHNGMLPQIYRKSGMDAYVFMRPDRCEKDIPADLFCWQSPDGSEVLAFRIPVSYGDWSGSMEDKDEHPVVSKMHFTKTLSEKQGFPMMCFYGVGNHGGGPTIASLRAIEAIMEQQPDLAQYASPQQYFDAVSEKKSDCITVKEDLQHHASGCYSANSVIKMLNRKAENRLLTAEKLMTCAYTRVRHPYDNDLLKRAWRKLMFNQFHDILAGCCIKEACEDAVETFGESISIASELANAALQKISWSIDTTGGSNPVLSKESDWMLWEREDKGVPVVIFNPHSFPVEYPIKINKEISGATDNNGNPLPIQKIRGSQTNQSDIYNTLLLAKLPPMGYTTCWIFKNRNFQSDDTTLHARAEGTILENESIRVEISPITGDIITIVNKEEGKNMLSSPAKSAIIDESDSDTWAHGVFEFSKGIGQFAHPQISVLENGPLRAAIRVEQTYEDTILSQDFSLLSGKKQIEVSVRMDIRMHHKLIKMIFPLAVENAYPVYSMPYGFICKQADGLEEPGQQWVAASSGAGPAFALINNGKYSFSLKGDALGMTVVRTPAYADHFGVRDDQLVYTDQGVSEFQYAILPCTDSFDAVVRSARVFNQPPEHIVETYHKGCLEPAADGINISCTNVIAEVFKRSEDDDGYILRLFEASGDACENVRITCLDRIFDLSFASQEIKTVFIPDDVSASVRERMITELDEQKAQ